MTGSTAHLQPTTWASCRSKTSTAEFYCDAPNGGSICHCPNYEATPASGRERKTATVGTVDKYKTEALAQKAVEALLLKLNSETPQQRMAVVTFGGICDRYLEGELPERYSTAKSYRSNIKNYLKPRWGDYLLDNLRPMAVEDWLKNLRMAPKSKAHIRSVMHLMFECATRWELFGCALQNVVLNDLLSIVVMVAECETRTGCPVRVGRPEIRTWYGGGAV